MQILLAAASQMEIKPFQKNHPAADVLITGVGIPSALYHLTKRIQLIDYDLVIQVGIAGSFKQEWELGKVVAVQKDTFSDTGIKTQSGFTTIFEAGLADPDHMPYKNGWLENPFALLKTLNYEKAVAITVNTITDDITYIREQVTKFDPAIESMEGAALHYVCLQEEVPFLQIRAISNYVGERNKSNWQLTEAIQNVNQELEKVLEEVKRDTVL